MTNEKISMHPDPRVRSRSIRERAELLDTAFCYALEEAAGMASPAYALAWVQVAAAVIAVDNQLDECNFGWPAGGP